jgi:hypothetical protein
MMVGHRAWHDGISLLSHLDKVANGPSMSMCARSTRGELYARWAVCHRGGPNLRSERLHITGTSVNYSFAGVLAVPVVHWPVGRLGLRPDYRHGKRHIPFVSDSSK